MDSVKKYLLMFVILAPFCELIKAKGLCEFAEMFPPDGTETFFTQGKSSKDDTQKGSSTLKMSTDTNASNDMPADIDCLDLYHSGFITSGVYTIYPTGWTASGFQVYCEMESNGGGWTVFQQRVDGTVNFYRNWTSYKGGFGILAHEFWLGNDKIHSLTSQGNYQLRIDAVNSRGKSVYSLYSFFSISDENNKYRLSVGTQYGNTVGDPLNYNNRQPFSTYDQDNDGTTAYHCAQQHHGGWWYNYRSDNYNILYHFCWKWIYGDSLNYCSDSNLNGGYQENGVKGLFFWYSNNKTDKPGCGITQTQMKIRRH